MNTVRKVLVGLALVALIFAAAAIFKKDSYVGFFYPDAGNLTVDIQSKTTFETLDECRAWAKVQVMENIRTIAVSQKYDYECGKNCRLSGDKPYVCEETLK